ncbi:HNH endonuclease [Rhizobium phaseoli]|uniref:HNH endonuclease n=1 Tax=Rhizobium phaseoli TaxID=396 RepID=UPI0025562051|nr:HNH endonuclease [Rhizobium phaseoli]MDK4730517.1 HNH endonuclease [Rhizobium phaseoli]
MPVPFSGCVIWLAGANEYGYGVFWNGERLEKAHRFALRLSGVEVPDDLDVLHKCDVPACVNANHLFVGTAQINVDDMWAKRRATVQRRSGTAQAQAKLTDGAAEDIRMLAAAGHKQRDIAALYDVSQRLVWNVIHFKNWKRESGVIVETGRGK